MDRSDHDTGGNSGTRREGHGRHSKAGRALLLAALGIVFGDIGTSPLYAFRESFLGGPALNTSSAHIFGVLSLIIWSLIVVISMKYLFFVMRADNQGEGGIIALVSLISRRETKQRTKMTSVLVVVGLFGAALLYGDGTITPAISVLSAVEGLEVATHAARPYVVPITIAILIGLFLIQKHGTMLIGKLFGPIMLVWFLTLAILGLLGIFRSPDVLHAFNPYWAVQFVLSEKWTAILVMGAVFLAVTGGEALYADMGHFGVQPIRRAWFFIVFPALVLNYLGQGALVLTSSDEIHHPFYHLAPDWFLYPLVILSTMATVIASQAVISGVFSLTRQAVQLDRLPRMKIVQTSPSEHGQIYIPVVNWLLMVATLGLVLGFGSSEKLASAYGLAIAMDMMITTVLASIVLARGSLPIWAILCVAPVFLVLDVSFLAANSVKFMEGGWYPVLAALLLFGVMAIWRTGHSRLNSGMKTSRRTVGSFISSLEGADIPRTPGTGIYISQIDAASTAPRVLVRCLEKFRALPATVIIFQYEIVSYPYVFSNRIDSRELSPSTYQLKAKFGFMETIDLPSLIREFGVANPDVDIRDVTYFLGRDIISGDRQQGVLPSWFRDVFNFMFVNTHRPHEKYNLPYEDVVEVGLRVVI